ncbi:MAG: 50S ribosomal protein L17 [Syntrophomonadaceae bacterium]|nr:50S ribosomal protein L17 [Syntrophomonadaceae bacterium]
MSYRRFGLRSAQRKSMLRNSVTSLLESEKITTTEARAKDIKRIADKVITLGKRGDLHSRRLASGYLLKEATVKKLFSTIADRYKDRQGGYTRIIKTSYRRGDGAQMVIIELV